MTRTTLNGAWNANDLAFNVTSATGATVGGMVRVEEEFSTITEIIGTLIKVRGRGDHGGVAKAHLTGAPVTFGLQSEIPALPERQETPVPDDESLVVYIADGAIAVPTRNTKVGISKGSAAAMTLANPSMASDGVEITIVGLTDFAHVVTTSVFEGTTGGAHTTLTSAAFAGSSVTLQAYGGRWYQKHNALWVLT